MISPFIAGLYILNFWVGYPFVTARALRSPRRR